MSTALDDPRIRRGMAAQAARMRADLAAGAKVIGWKVGFGAPAALDKLGITGPLVGYLLDRAVLASAAQVSFADWTKPVAEPELCVEMARDVAAGGSEADALAAIAAIGPAIELADLDLPPDSPETILAGDIFQRHVLFGPRVTRGSDPLAGLCGTVRRNGTVSATTSELEANTGRVGAVVRHVADLLAATGPGLRAGDVVICGSVVPPIFVAPDDRHIAFDLAPIGSVEVTIRA